MCWFIICFVTDFIDDLVLFLRLSVGFYLLDAEKSGIFCCFYYCVPCLGLMCVLGESNIINEICV